MALERCIFGSGAAYFSQQGHETEREERGELKSLRERRIRLEKSRDERDFPNNRLRGSESHGVNKTESNSLRQGSHNAFNFGLRSESIAW